ncbi:MAG: hypothetical protein HRU19_22655 [Pseudobacteriovorax sp.]|nr:hypothetical protein [Pseudobacteriovorax sp.]
MVKCYRILLVLIGFCFAGPNLWAKETVTFKHEGKPVLTLEAKKSLHLKKITSVELMPAKGVDISVISFDAMMPSHDHGMVVKATKPEKLKSGAYLVKGVKLHMHGPWVLEVKAKLSGKAVTLTTPFDVKM